MHSKTPLIVLLIIILINNFLINGDDSKINFAKHRHHHKGAHKRQIFFNSRPEYSQSSTNSKPFIPRSNLPDNWDRVPYLFQTYNEPELERYYLMPLISNGYIGTTAFNDSVYVNGLYSGRDSKSHRVRIPAMNSIYAFFDPNVLNPITTYTLDCRKGVYVKEMRTTNAIMHQRYYVHRQRNILINEIRVELLNNVDYAIIDLFNVTKLNLDSYASNNILNNPNKFSNYYQENDPEGILYEQRVIRHPTPLSQFNNANDGTFHLKGTIPETEIDNKMRKDIHIIYTNVPSKLYVYRNNSIKTFHFIQSVDRDYIRAQSTYEEAMRTIQVDPNGLYASHIAAWEDIWQKNGYAMVGESNVFTSASQDDFKVAQRLYASFYNLYSSIPFKLNWSPDSQFYGLSPAGLAYGALKQEYYNTTFNPIQTNRQYSEGYGGHITYHQDFWILPIISMFNQDMAKIIIQSRVRRGLNTDHVNILEQARDNAREENSKGVRYSNNQGDYGKDISPIFDVRKKRFHATGAVGFGLRSYLRMSHDRDFIANILSSDVGIKGEDFINEIAQYWNSKLQLSTNRNLYELNDLIFGDQNLFREVNNEAFTNHLAKICLDSFQYAIRLIDKDPWDSANSFKTKEYQEKIDKIYMPFDSSRKLYLEFDGFNPGQQNFETFVPFLNYPLLMSIDYSEKKQLLDSYSQQVGNDGKHTMTFASLVTGYLEINEESRAKSYFDRLSNHFNGPFLVMSEFPNNVFNPSNTFSYLPGYASYIHAFIGGYSAIRVRDYQIDIIYPSKTFNDYTSSAPTSSQSLPIKSPYQSLDYWNITGLSYRGFELDIIYNLKGKQLTIKNRRLTEGFQIYNTKNLEIIFYENEKKIYKSLNIGETQTFNLNTALWETNVNKKPIKPNYKNSYPNNIDVLVTIYSTQFRDYIQIDNNNAKYISFNFVNIIISMLLSIICIFKC